MQSIGDIDRLIESRDNRLLNEHYDQDDENYDEDGNYIGEDYVDDFIPDDDYAYDDNEYLI